MSLIQLKVIEDGKPIYDVTKPSTGRYLGFPNAFEAEASAQNYVEGRTGVPSGVFGKEVLATRFPGDLNYDVQMRDEGAAEPELNRTLTVGGKTYIARISEEQHVS